MSLLKTEFIQSEKLYWKLQRARFLNNLALAVHLSCENCKMKEIEITKGNKNTL